MLSIALLLAVTEPANTWDAGGGQAWINPFKSSQNIDPADLAAARDKARKGDVGSMRTVGYATLTGVADYSDPRRAMGWFYEAAVRGDAPSMYMLACAFEYGVGVTIDPKLAKYWHARAASFGAPKTCR